MPASLAAMSAGAKSSQRGAPGRKQQGQDISSQFSFLLPKAALQTAHSCASDHLSKPGRSTADDPQNVLLRDLEAKDGLAPYDVQEGGPILPAPMLVVRGETKMLLWLSSLHRSSAQLLAGGAE